MGSKARVIFTIVDYQLSGKVINFFKSHNIALGLATHGYGTATSEILSYLGLDEKKKSIVISLFEGNEANSVATELYKKLKLSKVGSGIVFTLPITSMNKFMATMIENSSKNSKFKKTESEETNMSDEHPYEIIFTIVAREHLEHAKDIAIKAGARGGTSINALGLGGDDVCRFLGITINPEKAIMLNVVKKEDKERIMQSIVKEVGIATVGKGICFSIPVDLAMGLSEDTI